MGALGKMKKYLNILLLVICLFGMIQSSSFAQDNDQKMVNLVKRMKSQYVKADKRMFNINWLPALDSDCRTNHVLCRSNVGQKVEKIGTLGCVDLKSIKYTITKGTTMIHALYSTLTCNLMKVIIETSSTNPKRYYVYNTQYPKAVLEKIVIVFNNGPMMSFKPDGKLDLMVYDDKSSCKREDNTGHIMDSSNARTLCRQIIMNGIPTKNYRTP